MKMRFKKSIIALGLFVGLSTSCNKFLDVVPDNAPVLDQAFAMRTMAERYLVTCYSQLPQSFSMTNNPGWLSGDEFWLTPNQPIRATSIGESLWATKMATTPC
jgi:hypothetical protein